MPPLQLLHYLLFAPYFLILARRGQNDPRAGDLLVGSASARDTSHGGIGDEPLRVREETVLDFDGGDLGAGDFKRILRVQAIVVSQNRSEEQKWDSYLGTIRKPEIASFVDPKPIARPQPATHECVRVGFRVAPVTQGDVPGTEPQLTRFVQCARAVQL